MGIWLYFLIPALPMALAPALFLPRIGPKLLSVAPWVPALALLLLPFYGEVYELPWLLLGARLGIDAYGLPLMVLALTAWTLAGWHARRTLPEARQPAFFFFWLLTWCGNCCVFLTLDAASFYAAYALMTFSAYGLVVHLGRPEDFRAGRVYLTMAVLGEALLISGLLLLAAEVGNAPLDLAPQLVAESAQGAWIAALMLAGFGVKMGLIGLHMWLPLAHPQAPVPASAVLSGVILKAGLMGWLRFLPLGSEAFAWLGMVLLAAGLSTAFYGAALGLAQQKVKALLAYSSVSQMGLVACLVALALLVPGQASLFAVLAVTFALHHGLAKSCLFLGVDLAEHQPTLARWLLWLPAAALAGLPLTSGALAKLAWKTALPEGWQLLEFWLTLSSLATTLLLLRFLALSGVFARSASAPAAGTITGRWPWPWLVLLLMVLVLPWLFAWQYLHPFVGVALTPAYQLDLLLPVGIAGLLAVAAALLAQRGRLVAPSIAPGDLINLLPSMPAWRLPGLPIPALPDWQAPLQVLQRHWQRLTPALVLAGLWLLLVFAGVV